MKQGTDHWNELTRQSGLIRQKIDDNRASIAAMDEEIVRRSNLIHLEQIEAGLLNDLAAAKAKASTKAESDAETAERKRQNGELEKAKSLYHDLTNAYKQYNLAKKNGDAAQQTYWSNVAQSSMAELNALNQKLTSLGLEEGIRNQILSLINMALNAEAAHNLEMEKSVTLGKSMSKGFSDIGKRIVQMVSSMIIYRTLMNTWREAITYVKEYYDYMNEIRIVTGMSQEEANRLGESYRNLADEMSVSSQEIANAATTFWRQGLSEDEVSARMEDTIRYAKISGLEFDEAAEIVTAAANTIEADTGRVVDVLAYLGDASASGPDEVGVAMQKASAAAKQFGLSFEWLGSYIATVSEATRLAPETIGTAFNTMMSRMHQIKQRGYNEEDETKINDVAKALNTVGIALMTQDGEWRELSDIFNDVAAKWNGMTAAQQSYIATTMAGVRQQNYFLALINDMAKGIEGGSRAWELYAGALGAAGTATEKYSIWQESVAAAQGNMKEALEGLYSIFDGETMKGIYNGIADIVNGFVSGTEAMNGMNVVLPILGVALVSFAVKAKKAGGALTLIFNTIKAHPVGLAITAIVAMTAALTALGNASSQSAEAFAEANNTIAEANERINELTEMQGRVSGRFTELSNKTSRTAEEQVEYNAALDEMAKISPIAKQAVDDLRDGYLSERDAISKVNEELERNLELERKRAEDSALKALRNWQPRDFDEVAPTSGAVTPLGVGEDIAFLINGDPDAGSEYVFRDGEIELVREEISDLIDLALVAAGEYNLSAAQKGVFRDLLMSAILGDDGQLSYGEYRNAARTVISGISEAMDLVLLKSTEATTDATAARRELIESTINDIFGAEYGKSVIQSLASEINSAAQSNEATQEILDAFQGLLSMGLSNSSIRKIFDNFSFDEIAVYGANGLIDELLGAMLGKHDDYGT